MIDSGDVDLLTQWMSEGHLPHFSRLEQEGVFAVLDSFDVGLAEVAQAAMITGCGPATNHYWGTHWYDPETYALTHRGGYDFVKRKPYFALGPDHRVAVIDFPQYRLHNKVHGLQLSGWGSHAPMTGLISDPPEFVQEVNDEFGAHPTLGGENESAVIDDPDSMQSLFDRLLAGVPLRTRLIRKVIDREPWDLLMVSFSETHKGGHYFFPSEGNAHFTKPDDRLYHFREIYIAVDRALGELMDCVGDDWNLVLYSIEGLCNNNEELDGIFALPEILLRDSFGVGAFEFEEENRNPSPERLAGIYDWTMEAWHLRRRPGKLTEWLRKKFSLETAILWERRFRLPPSPIHPLECDYLEYQPGRWLKPYWPHMRAFALPTFSEGFIRINLKGREASGVVPERRYHAECERIANLLTGFRHALTGEPMVLQVKRTREVPHYDGLDVHFADLIVKFNNNCPSVHFISDSLGEIGPLPPMRAASHAPRGFFIGKGPGVPSVSDRIHGHILDLAPTILSLAGLAPQQPLDGKPLVPSRPRLAACLCVRNEDRFLRENLLYHHAVGVDKVYLFADRCTDHTIETALSFPWVDVYELDPNETASLEYITDIHTRCMDLALSFARKDRFDWLLMIDADELAYAGNLDRDPGHWESMSLEDLLEDANLKTLLGEISWDIFEVRLKTREIVPALEWASGPFYQQTYYYGPGEFQRELHHPVTGQAEPWEGFLGHVQGKSIIRTCARVSAHDSHRWAPEQTTDEGQRPVFAPVPGIGKGWHAHYFLTSGTHLREKGGKHSFQPAYWPCRTPVEKPIEIFKETARSGTDEQVERSATRHFLQPLERLQVAAERLEVTLDTRIKRIIESLVFDSESASVNEIADRRATRVSLFASPSSGDLNYDPSMVRNSRLNGFHPVELYHNTPFRWMEPNAIVAVTVPPGRYLLKVGVIPDVDHAVERLQSLSIKMGETALTQIKIDAASATLSVAVTIKESAGDSTQLKLSIPADKKFIAREGSRVLALPVRLLHFVPIDEG